MLLPEPCSPFVTLTAAAHPFRVSRDVVMVREGQSLAEMLHEAQPDPILARHASIFIHGHIIPRENWHRVYPKAGTHVEIRVLPMGGGGGGGEGNGKNGILNAVLLIVVAVASVFTYGYAAAAYGAVYGSLAAGAVSIVGTVLVNAVVPLRPPKSPRQKEAERVFSIEGSRNQARPFQPVPQPLGRHRMVPDYGAAPYTELIGGDQYLRLLFVWGVGPLQIDTDSLRIGETPIADFEGVEMEHRSGYADDEPLTLYPGTVVEDDLSIMMETDVWEQRTTAPDADEISIDMLFPEGCWYNKNGKTLGVSVAVTVQYRLVGTAMWKTPTPSVLTVGRMSGSRWVTGDLRKREPFRLGMRWSVGTRGQYEVRVERDSKDWSVEDGRYDDLYWTALRTITNEDPIRSRVPVAKTAMRIRATDQLNGVVDQFNGIVTTVGKHWNGSEWIGNWPITNPASLFRHILQGNGNPAPLADSRIDLARLQTWHTWCEEKGFAFSQVRDGEGSVWDALADCAAAGRAAPGEPDGKWAPIIDDAQSVPVSHITPHNSFDFNAEKAFIELPHAFRIPFQNEEQDYRLDERRVYRPGYDATTATKFEELPLVGITNPEQIWSFGRYRMAQGIHQPERFTWGQDIEFLTYQRGDRVAITHDVLLVGLRSGRIASVTVDGSNNVTALELDETVTMEAAETYGIAIRTVAHASITRQVVTVEGDTTTLTLSTSIQALSGEPAVARGDLFGFGLLGSETDAAQIISITPENDVRARIAAVPYRDEVYEADSEEIPPFETNLTPLRTIPAPTITSVVSNETALAVGEGGTLRTRIVIAFRPLRGEWLRDAVVDVQGRPSGFDQAFDAMPVDERSNERVAISGVRDGETWDIRLRFRVQDRPFPGPWAYVYNHRIIGKSSAPNGLSGLTISAFGGQALLRWDRPEDLDVLFGGEVRFRHSPLMTGASWASSVSIGTSARSSDLLAALPLKAGTYLARVFDSSGQPSVDVASVTTKQASVLTWGAASALDEDPTFSGTHGNTLGDSSVLRLDTAGLLDTIADFDEVENLDAYGGTQASGTYDFLSGYDFGSVVKRRLTTRITAASTNVLTLIDERGDEVDSWEDFDGDTQGSTDAQVEVRHTDDDPAGAPNWSAWERLDSAEFEARAFDFRAVLTSADPAFNILITDLGVDAEAVV